MTHSFDERSVVTFKHLPWVSAASFGSDQALADDRLSLSHHEYGQRVRAVAELFAARGVGPGDVVAIVLPNRIELLIAMGAAWYVGATATPVNPAFTDHEAAYQLDDSDAKIIVTDNREFTGRTTVDIAEFPAAASTDAAPHETQADDIALLIYTSGSTGRPKGVMLDHANLAAMTAIMGEHTNISAADHCFLILPLFHVNAIVVSALTPLGVGGRVTMTAKFSPSTFFDQIEKHRPTYFSAVPAIYAMLTALPEDVKPDTSSLRFVVCGAAPISKELLDACAQRFGFTIIEGYGLTEATCASACNPVDGVRKLGTVGPVLKGQRLKTVRPDGSECATGEPGEVLIAGPTIMRGYLGNPQATAETIRNGWLHTGDIGHLDEDGYLTLVDRIKDMIIRGGENLYPKEIENAISQHPEVLEVAVVGKPDAVLGEVPVASVVLYPDSQATAEELLEHCRERLMRHKVPAELTVVEALPKNPVGKIDKPAIRRAL